MIPTALIFSRYKSFKERVVLNLAPLNVIIGRNGSGKSVISRLPLLLASGLKDEAEAPVDLFAGGVLHSSRYEDLIYERSAQPFELGAQIGQGLRSLRFITTLRFVIEKHTLAIERFELYEGEDRLLCQLEIDSPDELLRQAPRYRRQQPRGEATIQSVHTVHFEGLFPDWVSDDESLSTELTRIRSHFKAAFANPAYLGPFRSHANEGPTLPGQGIRVLGPRGERAGDMVADDKLRGAGELTRLVENWFEESMGGSRVTLKQNDRNPTLVVFDSERNIEVDLSETGAGFSQVLPVVVQTFARVLGRIKSPLLITEQPELHLHPAAHGAVGDLFITAVNNSTAMLPVTYSEGFNLEDALDQLLGDLEPYGFGDVSRKTILQGLLHAAGQSFVKPKFDDLRRADTQSSLMAALPKVSKGLIDAARFLNGTIGFSTGKLLPYALQLLLLQIFFSTSKLSSANLSDDIKLTLRRWFWATSFEGWFASANTSEMAESVNVMETYARSPSDAEAKQGLEAFFIDRPLRPFPASFDRRSARIRALLLVQIVNGPLYDPVTKAEQDGSKLLADPERRDLPYIFPLRSGVEARSPANRILLDRRYGSSVRQFLLEHLDDARLMEQHSINNTAKQALNNNDLRGFIAAREAELERREDLLLKSVGLSVSDQTDRADEDVDVDDE